MLSLETKQLGSMSTRQSRVPQCHLIEIWKLSIFNKTQEDRQEEYIERGLAIVQELGEV